LRDTWPRLAPSLEADVSRAIIEAQAAGDNAAVSDGFFVLSGLHHDTQDYRRAEENSLAALEAARDADPTLFVQQLANTGRGMLLIEGDIARARTLVGEAQVLAKRISLDDAEISWGAGLVYYWDGDYDAATESLHRAHIKARDARDRWREHQSLEWLMRLDLE